MRTSTKNFSLPIALLGTLALSSSAFAGVVTTLGAPTSTNNTIGVLPTWNNNGDTQDATFTSYIDFSPNAGAPARQLIWETGGSTRGASLIYGPSNTLYLRVRDGGNIADITWQLTANQISAGELFVGWVFDQGNDEIRLLMDGLDANNRISTVAKTPFAGTDWSSSAAAGWGDGADFVGGYSGFSAFTPDPFTSGTINTAEGLDFYQDQALLVSPVPEPLGVLAGTAAIGFTCFRRRRQLT